MRRLFFALLLLAAACTLHAAEAPRLPVIATPNPGNAAATLARHYVVLVSIDGFRYDYARLYGAPHIDAMAKEGASAPDGMIPSYPSVTFPNHYTLVTGLYPEHHGIVGMTFYDPARRQGYAYNDPTTADDGSWYGGVPLWSLAERQGMRSACFFWPGSEAKIAGFRPSYYLRYDESIADEARVGQVLDWLRLPPEQRPHFITLYFSEVDHAGHRYGPDSPQVRAAVQHVDGEIGHLRAGLRKLHLPIDLIVVSDHGMVKLSGPWVDLDRYADFTGVSTTGDFLYPGDEAAADRIYHKLRIASSTFKVYRRSHVPVELHFSGNPRVGDPVIVPTGPYAIRVHAPQDPARDRPPNPGGHGYDPGVMPEMRAIFFAEGPDIRRGARLRPFENVNLYPFVAGLLGLDPPATDGDAAILAPARATQGRE